MFLRRSLASASEEMISIGSATRSAFQSLLTRLKSSAIASEMEKVDNILRQKREPEFWRKDVERLYNKLRIGLDESHSHDVMDLAGRVEDKLTMLQEFVLSYGLLLKDWPKT